MPKTRVHSTLCKVLARSQPTLTTQELQFYSWSRELVISQFTDAQRGHSFVMKMALSFVTKMALIIVTKMALFFAVKMALCFVMKMALRPRVSIALTVTWAHAHTHTRAHTYTHTHKHTHTQTHTHTHTHTHARTHKGSASCPRLLAKPFLLHQKGVPLVYNYSELQKVALRPRVWLPHNGVDTRAEQQTVLFTFPRQFCCQ